MDNCIVAGSTVGEGVYDDDSSTTLLACCDLFGNAGGDWVGGIADQYGQNGNLCADPLFCDPDNDDFTLAADSPCLPENNDCGELIGITGMGCAAVPVAPEQLAVPSSRVLQQNVPNPFNPSTVIRYTLPVAAAVRISVLDVAGRQLRLLHDGHLVERGEHAVEWDGRDNRGRLVPSGTYFYRLAAGDFSETRAMVLLR